MPERPDTRVPGRRGIHHEWFRNRFARIGREIAVDFDGRPVFRYEDPQPLPAASSASGAATAAC